MSNTGPINDRLEALLTLRGQELIQALVKELRSLNREVDNLNRELEALRSYQIAKQRLLVTDSLIKSSARLPGIASIDATQLLYPRQGFYPLEHTRQGVAFRWTGPSTAFSFDVFVDRTRGAEIELHALSCVNFERQKNIVLLVDGDQVPVHIARKGESLSLRATASACAEPAATHLEFAVPEVLRAGSGSDPRLLGLSFASLTVRARAEDATESGEFEKSEVEIIELIPRSAKTEEADASNSGDETAAVS